MYSAQGSYLKQRILWQSNWKSVNIGILFPPFRTSLLHNAQLMQCSACLHSVSSNHSRSFLPGTNGGPLNCISVVHQHWQFLEWSLDNFDPQMLSESRLLSWSDMRILMEQSPERWEPRRWKKNLQFKIIFALLSLSRLCEGLLTGKESNWRINHWRSANLSWDGYQRFNLLLNGFWWIQ